MTTPFDFTPLLPAGLPPAGADRLPDGLQNRRHLLEVMTGIRGKHPVP